MGEEESSMKDIDDENNQLITNSTSMSTSNETCRMNLSSPSNNSMSSNPWCSYHPS